MLPDPLTLLRVAQDAAVQAGTLLREEWREPQRLPDKGFRDWVTESDLKAQRLITRVIGSQFPGHGFLTEEEDDALPTGGPVTWIVDPIDGTSNFSRQQPNFCVSLAATAGDMLLAGVIYDPIRREIFSAATGRESSLDGRPVKTSAVATLDEAIIALDWAHGRAQRETTMAMVGALAHRVHTIRALGSAALALAWVGAGRLDAYLNVGLKPWDVAAAALLIRQAGGRLTDWYDQPWSLDAAGATCLASNGPLHEQLLAALPT